MQRRIRLAENFSLDGDHGKLYAVLPAPAAVLRDDCIRGNLFRVTFDLLNPPPFVELNLGKIWRVGQDYIVTAQTLPICEAAEKLTNPALRNHGTGDIVLPYTYSLSYKKIYRRGEDKLLERVDQNRIAKITADFFARQLKK